MAGAKVRSSDPWQSRHPAFGCRTKQTASESRENQTGARLGLVKPRASVSLTWEGATYPHVAPGVYRAVCEAWQGPEYCAAFHRYSLRLQFSLLDDGTRVSLFLNFDKSGPPGRASKFYRAWSMANGEQPRRGQKMTLETFTEPGLIYTVQVEDSTKNEKGELKPDALVYSRVKEILRVERP